ncbi:MAG: carbamoyltransferase N-terminal domain-containing protein [Vicinamibacterales bacterium]
MRHPGHFGLHHDSAAALLRNGEIVAAGLEERFTCKKGDSTFPHRAVEFCLAAPASASPTCTPWAS